MRTAQSSPAAGPSFPKNTGARQRTMNAREARVARPFTAYRKDHHGRSFQVGQHPASQGASGRQALQPLDEAGSRNHRGRPHGRRRSGVQLPSPPRPDQGPRRQRAQGHHLQRHSQGHRPARRRLLRRNPLRRLRHRRRCAHHRLHDRQPSPTSATRSRSTAATSARKAPSPSCSSTSASSSSPPASRPKTP